MIVNMNELRMKKGFDVMNGVKLCANYDNDIAIRKKSVPLQQRNIKREMTIGYMRLLSNLN